MIGMRFGKQATTPMQLAQIQERQRGAKCGVWEGANRRRQRRLTTNDGLTRDVNPNDAKLAQNCSLSRAFRHNRSVCSRSPFIEIRVGDGFALVVHYRFLCVGVVSVKVDHELVISPDPGIPHVVKVVHGISARAGRWEAQEQA